MTATPRARSASTSAERRNASGVCTAYGLQAGFASAGSEPLTVSVRVPLGFATSDDQSIVSLDPRAPVTVRLMRVRYDVKGATVMAAGDPGAAAAEICMSMMLSLRQTGEIVVPVPPSVSP